MEILLIGAGQIGSRHLQGLAELSDSQIYLVDPSKNSLDVAMQRFADVMKGNRSIAVTPLTHLASLEKQKNIDVAIIATDARVRAEAFKNASEHLSIKNVIFEKVLFQKETEYLQVADILQKNSIKAWVNCPMRMWPSYRNLKKEYFAAFAKNVRMEVTGGNWGLACNAIHYIDVFSYLTDSRVLSVSNSGLIKVIPSKRVGFSEIVGCIKVEFTDGHELLLSAEEGSAKPVLIHIEGSEARHLIFEDKRKRTTQTVGDDWKNENFDFETPYQSQLSGSIVKEIFELGESSLPTFESSSEIHISFIKSLNDFFIRNRIVAESGDPACPIT